MAMLERQDRLRTAVDAVPKAWMVIGLSLAAWALLIVGGVEVFALLRNLFA